MRAVGNENWYDCVIMGVRPCHAFPVVDFVDFVLADNASVYGPVPFTSALISPLKAE
jgi:hypothetical protein